MAIKVLDMDLYQGLTPIIGSPGYQSYRILVKICRQPVGWINVPATTDHVVSVEQLHYAISNQISWQIIQKAFALQFQLRNINPYPAAPISVVVCTRNRTEQLASCLHALLALNYSNYEIIVVDNAPDNDETYELTRNLNVRYN